MRVLHEPAERETLFLSSSEGGKRNRVFFNCGEAEENPSEKEERILESSPSGRTVFQKESLHGKEAEDLWGKW